MNLKPLHDWLVIKPLDPALLENSSITSMDWYGLSHSVLIGEVLAVGPGRYAGPQVREKRQAVFHRNGKRHASCIKTGDIVGFHRNKRELDRRAIDGEIQPCLWVRERDIEWVAE